MTLKVPSPRFFIKRRDTNKPTPKYFSLIDLGADTIKVAIVEIHNSHVKVLGHGLVSAQGRDIAGGRAQAAALSSEVNQTLQEIEDATEKVVGRKIVPDDALFVLPGRTLAGKLFKVKQRRQQRNQPVSQEDIDTLWDRALRLARQQLPKLPNVGADWLPQTVTQAGLWLDDRLVNDPIGLQGRVLSLAIYSVISQAAIIRGIEQLATRLEVEIYGLIPASQSLATIIPTQEALVLDVGASGTDCYLIRHDALVAVGRIAMGGNFFTRSIKTVFKCDFQNAEALKVAFASDVLSQADMTLVKQGLYQPLKQWARAITETLKTMVATEFELELPPQLQLPSQVYYVGGSAVLPGLKNQLRYTLKENGFNFKRSLEVINLGQAPLTGFTNDPIGFRGILFALALSLAKTV